MSGYIKIRVLDRLLVGISDILGVIWLLRRAPRQIDVIEVVTALDRGLKGNQVDEWCVWSIGHVPGPAD